MEITYIGHSSFVLKTRECKVVTDPFSAEIGIKFPKTVADVVTVSHHHSDHDTVSGVVAGDNAVAPMVFDWPGEFEKNGVRIFGFQSFHDTKQGAERGENVIFKFEIDGLSIVHCGDLGHVPDDKLTDAVGDVDILMVPVGGHSSLDAKHAFEAVKKFDPSIVIPMHYGHGGLSAEMQEKLAPLGEFLKVMGAESVQPITKYVVKKEDIAEKEHEVVTFVTG